MQRQSIGRAILLQTGGFFVMTTNGRGTLLCNTFGSLKRLDLENDMITIDNNHVAAWDASLDYDIHLGNGEGVVNTFRSTGSVYIQSLNLEPFAGKLSRYIAAAAN